MEPYEYKNGKSSDPKELQLTLDEAKEATLSHRKLRKLKDSPAYFLSTHFLEQFTNLPGFNGLIIHPGIKKIDGHETEILIVIPATIHDGKVQEISKYQVKINDFPPESIQLPFYRALGPCPPHPPTPCPVSLAAWTLFKEADL